MRIDFLHSQGAPQPPPPIVKKPKEGMPRFAFSPLLGDQNKVDTAPIITDNSPFFPENKPPFIFIRYHLPLQEYATPDCRRPCTGAPARPDHFRAYIPTNSPFDMSVIRENLRLNSVTRYPIYKNTTFLTPGPEMRYMHWVISPTQKPSLSIMTAGPVHYLP